MDRISTSQLEEFVAANTLEALPEDSQFEHFCGTLLTSRHYSESFEPTDIAVGAGGDCGIDCIAILVNGRLVTDPDDIAEIADASNYLDATFVFVQAERSVSFNSAKIGALGYGVSDFFSETPRLVRNDDVVLAAEIANAVFARAALFRKGNPQYILYYATTGRWTDDADLVARRDSVVEDLEGLNLFRKVHFECIDARRLHEAYRLIRNALHVEIRFSTKITLPDLPGVQQSYLGILPAAEFLKLVETEDGEIRNSVFYDNVRDWQEWNPVNTGMRNAIEDDNIRNYFPLMNNGVTVVAASVMSTADRFVIEDYQIVNGCQTSYVLHETKEHHTPELTVPVRLIATTDPAIKSLVAKATNRQTAVSDDQLFALSDFPKDLEAYYSTFRGDQTLYLERRSKQYSADPTIQRIRVVDLRTVVRAFASLFLNLPHRTTRNYKALRESIGTEIFGVGHKHEPYYVAGYAHFRLEQLFRTQVIERSLRPARYHILLAFRFLAAVDNVPRLNSRDMVRYSTALQSVLWDEPASRDLFLQAAEIVAEVAAGNLHRDNIRTEGFTAALIARLRPPTR